MSQSAVPTRQELPPTRLAALGTYLAGHLSVALSLVVILLFAAIALLAPWVAPHDPLAQSFLRINAPPSADHWLGTDQFGRDVLSRLLYGSRNSLIFGLIPPVIAAVVGTCLGVAAAYFGGWLDRIVSRAIDMLLAFPDLLLAIMIASVLGGGFWNVVGVITIAFIPGFTRVARASALSVKQEPYIEAGVSIGERAPTIIFQHIIPNISAPIVVLMTLWVAAAIRIEASLS
ncbi:MAG: ABC transporter permease, partial [Alphaproteobacteria bacterium]